MPFEPFFNNSKTNSNKKDVAKVNFAFATFDIN